MYLIPIAWLYVVILVAAAEDTLVAAALTFVFWGLAPLALFLWLFGTPARRRQAHARAVPEKATQPADANQTSDANRPVTPSRR